MPTETSKSTERCEAHPGSPSVAHCGRCGRTLCIVCAIPVRGSVLGSECLPPDVAGELRPGPARRAPMPRIWAVAGLALIVLVGSTAFPWTPFGVASGWLGAWGYPLRWSMLSATAGALALLTWCVMWIVRSRSDRLVGAVVGVLSIAAASGAALAIVNPPPFTKAAIAPFAALVAALVATGVALRMARPSSV